MSETFTTNYHNWEITVWMNVLGRWAYIASSGGKMKTGIVNAENRIDATQASIVDAEIE